MSEQPPVGSAPGAGDPSAAIDVLVESLAPGGDAVGHQQGGAADGRTTFVALAAPGELVRARLLRQKTRVAWAELLEIRRPSAARVTPPCPLFGRCGGCQWQHVSLAEQRRAKGQIVARALGLHDVPVIVPAATAGGAGYRDRAQLAVGPGGELGFRARRSHAVIDVERCLLLGPAAQAALAGIRAARLPASARWPAGAEIDLQAGREGVHVAVSPPASGGGTASPAFTVEAGALLARWRASGVVGVRVNAAGGAGGGHGGTGRGGSRSGGTRSGESTAGLADVDLAAPGEPALRVPAGAFAQVGASGNAALIAAVLAAVDGADVVTGAGGGARRAWELYAGSGNFTRHLLGRGWSVEACDGDAAAVERGKRFAPGAVWSRRPPGQSGQPPRQSGGGEPDLVLVDPPREGLDAAHLAAAVRARARVVYVSCDPQTLARDAAGLRAAGFAVSGAVALDLLPHSFHTEVVATFDRAPAVRAPAV